MRFPGFQHCQKMIIPSAETAGTLQPGLVQQEDGGPAFHGGKRRSAEIIADNIYFGDSKRDAENGGGYASSGSGYSNGYSSAPAPAAAPSYNTAPGSDQFSDLSDDDPDLPF